MESRIQRWSWVAHLVFIGVAAALLASVVTRYVAIHLAPFTVPELPALEAPSPDESNVRKPRAKTLAKPIVDRCWFGCPEAEPPSPECPDGCPDGQVCEAGACVDNPDAAPSEQLIASDLTAKLLGVMVAKDPQYSVALFSDSAAKTTFIVGIGDMLMGQVEVIDITRDRVIVQRGNQFEYIQLANTLSGLPTLAGVPGAATPAARPARGGTAAKTPSRANLGGGAGRNPTVTPAPNTTNPTVAADGAVELSKAVVEAELANETKLANSARVVPNYVDGKPAGVKLVGVREDSVYRQLGIQSGDVVTSINGTPVKNQAHAFELIQSLRGRSDASIGVERGSESKTLKYRVK